MSQKSNSHNHTDTPVHSELQRGQKPCRSCVDFKTWMKQTNKTAKEVADAKLSLPLGHDCPLDRDELGRSTWGLLHTMAANYPEKPTNEQKVQMKSFMSSFSQLYPCEVCAYDFRKRMKKEPVDVDSHQALSQWMCRIHNQVNKMLGKPVFDCAKVDERWRDGWNDGSCG